ncbi:hypothetical protein KC660_04775 [Candidatus Dojkabacteria bacterium]|uniref:Uncharacterized protein n=1 Tax=Candidatus Dojkabacteria bacterium TaxID=2099670 RepID=A0A955L4W6_9BACT|nr:hypothetical protein [Candidatus Dojkabacteria bacterium]
MDDTNYIDDTFRQDVVVETIDIEKNKLVSPQKAKTSIITAFKVLCWKSIEEMENYRSIQHKYTLSLLIQDCINQCDDIDE